MPSTASSSGVSAAPCSLRDPVVGRGTDRDPLLRSSSRLPISRIRPSDSTRIPCPSSTSHSSCGGIVMSRSSVDRMTAWASGCREWISELAA